MRNSPASSAPCSAGPTWSPPSGGCWGRGLSSDLDDLPRDIIGPRAPRNGEAERDRIGKEKDDRLARIEAERQHAQGAHGQALAEAQAGLAAAIADANALRGGLLALGNREPLVRRWRPGGHREQDAAAE